MNILFPEEQIITESSEGIVVLTTHRICYTNSSWGNSYNQSIMLEHITSCESFYSAQIWLLILSGASIIGCFFDDINNESYTLIIAITVAFLSLMLYFSSRRSLIRISSPSTKMEINVKNMDKETVMDFINKVEQAINKRVMTKSR